MAQPSDEIRAKLEQQKQDFMRLALLAQQQKQATWNAEQMANKNVPGKAKGGLEKFLEHSHVKQRMYHGTGKDFSSFEPNTRGVHFVTPNPDVANLYAGQEYSVESGESPNVMPLYVSAKNPFDYENKKHRDALAVKAALSPNARKKLKEGLWHQLEDRTIMHAIKNMGHDSLYVNEHGAKNLGVFHPHQIKSAIGNRGTYDINDPDITKARGGIVKKLRKHGQGVPNELEAMKRMSNGHKVFVVHEQDEHPREVTSVQELAGYAPDQIYTLAPEHKAEGGNVNAFDYENPEHVSAVAQHMAKHKDFKGFENAHQLLGEVLSTGNYRHIEDPRAQEAMRKAGHNAYHLLEKTGKKLHPIVVKKAMGGTIQSSVNQMRTALMENKFAVPASDIKSVGAQEAPQLDTKVYVNEGGQNGMGGVDVNATQPGMQLMQAQPNLDPKQNQPQQGGQPLSAGASSPAQQPPSNILQMTPQGQAMNAMTPPQGLKDGGKVKHQITHEMYMQLLKRHLAGERLSKAENEMLGLYHRVGGGKKLKKPIGEYSFTTAPNPKVKMAAEKLVTPEDLVGGYGIPFIGDSSMAGRLLTGAEGHQFHQPVELEGGHDYMRASQHEDPSKRAIWASAQSKISHLTNKAKRVAEHGEPVYGIHTSMSPTGVDFSHMPVEVLAELVKNAKITKKAQNAFNKEMRAQHPEFPGVMHEELHDMLRAPGAGELRKHFVERMATDPYQEAGFPEIAMARLAVQHPNLMRHDEPGKEFVGSSIGRFRPDFGQVEAPLNPHHSYPSVIGGEYVGALHPENAQPLMTTKEFFPEFHKQRREFNAPEAGDRRAFELAQPVQKFDQEWLDKVMPVYLKRRKKILGYKKGSKVDDNLDTMRLSLTKNSKKKAS
jgi:hypothetical protein